MTIHVGFTGTRALLGEYQKAWIQQELDLFALTALFKLREKVIFHHGDCVGADAYAHEVALQLGWRVVLHPPLNQRYRAYCKGAWREREAQKYYARDRRIAQASSILWAAPGSALILDDRGRGVGGTWYTALYAMQLGRTVYVCQAVS